MSLPALLLWCLLGSTGTAVLWAGSAVLWKALLCPGSLCCALEGSAVPWAASAVPWAGSAVPWQALPVFPSPSTHRQV